jgi:flagellar hook assembly protein FlgD
MAVGAARAQAVDIYDVAGRLVTSVRPTVENGLAQALWHGDDASGAKVSAGIYFVRVQGHDLAVKIVLVK